MKRNLHLLRASLALAGFAGVAALVFWGAVPCLSARYLHVPCPACGSTRATRALLALDFAGVLHTNPLGPVMAALFATFVVRTVFFTARDGNVRAVVEGRLGRFVPYAMAVTYACEVVLWALRFFGLFGGPCPV
jgi:hypothetical protein